MFKINKVILACISFLISAATFILVFIIVYNVSCMVSPPYIVEENGEIHGLMPIGQMMLGIIVGIFSGLILWIIMYRYGKRKFNLK